MQIPFSELWYWFLIAAVCCYFVGCFNFAVIISKLKKSDIREIGSGNPGTMNMTRTFGVKIGVINFFCDALKGGLPVLAAYFIFRNTYFEGTNIEISDFARYFFGLFVVIGHVFPVTMKFKGGKGIASTLGMFWVSMSCEQWWFVFVGFALLILVVVYIAVCEWGSMGSLLGVSTFSVWQLIIFITRYKTLILNGWVIAILSLILLINLITWLAHAKNLYKVLGGEERRTQIIKKK